MVPKVPRKYKVVAKLNPIVICNIYTGSKSQEKPTDYANYFSSNCCQSQQQPTVALEIEESAKNSCAIITRQRSHNAYPVSKCWRV
jgi:hypothetical protein